MTNREQINKEEQCHLLLPERVSVGPIYVTICPICKGNMGFFLDTLVCPRCDTVPISDLVWCKEYLYNKKKEKEKKL